MGKPFGEQELSFYYLCVGLDSADVSELAIFVILLFELKEVSLSTCLITSFLVFILLKISLGLFFPSDSSEQKGDYLFFSSSLSSSSNPERDYVC